MFNISCLQLVAYKGFAACVCFWQGVWTIGQKKEAIWDNIGKLCQAFFTTIFDILETKRQIY